MKLKLVLKRVKKRWICNAFTSTSANLSRWHLSQMLTKLMRLSFIWTFCLGTVIQILIREMYRPACQESELLYSRYGISADILSSHQLKLLFICLFLYVYMCVFFIHAVNNYALCGTAFELWSLTSSNGKLFSFISQV